MVEKEKANGFRSKRIPPEVRQAAKKLSNKFVESFDDPQKRKEAERFHRSISQISGEDLARRFTI